MHFPRPGFILFLSLVLIPRPITLLPLTRLIDDLDRMKLIVKTLSKFFGKLNCDNKPISLSFESLVEAKTPKKTIKSTCRNLQSKTQYFFSEDKITLTGMGAMVEVSQTTNDFNGAEFNLFVITSSRKNVELPAEEVVTLAGLLENLPSASGFELEDPDDPHELKGKYFGSQQFLKYRIKNSIHSLYYSKTFEQIYQAFFISDDTIMAKLNQQGLNYNMIVFIGKLPEKFRRMENKKKMKMVSGKNEVSVSMTKVTEKHKEITLNAKVRANCTMEVEFVGEHGLEWDKERMAEFGVSLWDYSRDDLNCAMECKGEEKKYSCSKKNDIL